MKTAEITLRPRQINISEKVKNKLSWRDSWRDPVTGDVNEIVYEGEGGDIRFFYDPITRRMIPHVVDVYKPGVKNTYSQIKKFISGIDFDYVVESDIPDTEVVVKISDKKLGKQFGTILSDLEQYLFGAKFCDFDVKLEEIDEDN